MPWKESSEMDEKKNFIDEMLEKKMPFKHLCDKYGISEKTGHKWKTRYHEDGINGLINQSKAPKEHPNALSEDVITSLIKLKKDHIHWGGKKILALYIKINPTVQPPSLSSVNRILNKCGFVEKRKTKPVLPEYSRLRQYIQPKQTNDVWAIDFKGWWTSSGEICEPFTVRDLTSRKILCVKLMTSKSSEAVRDVMTDLFKKYGLPKVIRSDNGTPFSSSNGLLSLTKLSVWWISLGIIPDRTDKGRPGQNGSLERMHADIAREVQGKISGGIKANQAVLDQWVIEYNSIRPNEAIGLKTPDDIYTPSPRKYQGDFDEIEYPLGFLTRKTLRSGKIKLAGFEIMISSALTGFNLGLRPNENNTFDVFVCDFMLGTIDLNTCCFIALDSVK